MAIYRDLDRYFDYCENCGECCKNPGMFLPEQIDVLAQHFGLSRKELYDRYLIAELCAPRDEYRTPEECLNPVFVYTPVKVDSRGERLPQRIFDESYLALSDCWCIFRDRENKGCSINQIKPFECAVMLCRTMTHDNPIYIGKNYFYHRWKDALDISFSIFPGLEESYARLSDSMKGIRTALEKKNAVLNQEILPAFNRNPQTGEHRDARL